MTLLVSAALAILPAHADERPWNALVVYDNGDTKITSALSTEAKCREVLCYIEHGQSCSDREAEVQRQREEQKRRDEEYERKVAEWRATHPCVTKSEDWGVDTETKKPIKKTVERCSFPNGSEVLYVDGGAVQYSLSTDMTTATRVGMYGARSIKTRACFPEPQ